MKKVSISGTILLFSLTMTSSTYGAGYGAAGCGVGSILFGDSPGFIQVSAVTTNVSSGQTFAITTGTSNCDTSTGVTLPKKKLIIFIEKNFDNIIKEISAGEGENLNNLAGLMGCSSDKISAFNKFAQTNYAAIMKSKDTTPEEMLAALKKELSDNEEMKESCSNIKP